jgi:hypothetical protein
MSAKKDSEKKYSQQIRAGLISVFHNYIRNSSIFKHDLFCLAAHLFSLIAEGPMIILILTLC